MTAPFQNMSDVLTSEQSMSCMDKTPCAFSQATMSAFCARFTSKVVGVAVATSILFVCRLSSSHPAGRCSVSGTGKGE